MSFIHPKKLKRRLKYFILIALGLYVMLASSLYFIQEKLLFLPTQLPQDYVFEFRHNFEEVFLNTDDNATINAIHFKADEPQGVILYFHGNAGDLSRWGTIAEYFVGLDYDVLIMDYRTYGKSVGSISEKALYADAQMCYDYLLQHGYSKEDIVLYGRSLGTGIASYLASENTARQLILETPYYSIEDVAKHRFPYLPVKRLLKYKLPTHAYLESVKCPTLIVHGTDDYVVPFSSGKKLSELNLPHVEFITVEGGSHNNLIEFDAYLAAMNTHLKYKKGSKMN